MDLKLTAKADGSIKFRNKVPVIRRWKLVWEYRESPPKRIAESRQIVLPILRDPNGAPIFVSIYTLDLGEIDVQIAFEKPGFDGESLILSVNVIAFGDMVLARQEFDVSSILGGLPASGKKVVEWTVPVSGRGVDVKFAFTAEITK